MLRNRNFAIALTLFATASKVKDTNPDPPSASKQAKPSAPAAGEAGTAESGKRLANPIASLVSVPFQSNFNFGLGPNNDGFLRYSLNFLPMIPTGVEKVLA
jgi:hypothetical protein